MKIRKTKKGFTIVELVIVIAVIGILAAILIPTFIGLTNRANEASDNALVNNLNKALKMEEGTAGHEKSVSMQGAINDLKNQGYLLNQISSKSGKVLVWDQVENQFLLNDAAKGPKDDARYWKIANGINDDAQHYSIYAGEGWNQAEVSGFKFGFDAGERTNITKVTYASSDANEVVIRTNSFATDVVINTDKSVNHFGDVGKLDIQKVAMASFHEFGNARAVTIKEGNFVVENKAVVTLVSVTATEANKVKFAIQGEVEVVAGDPAFYQVTAGEEKIEETVEAQIENNTIAIVDGTPIDTIAADTFENGHKVVLLKDYTPATKVVLGNCTVIGNYTKLGAKITDTTGAKKTITLKNIHSAGLEVAAFYGKLTLDGGLLESGNPGGTKDEDAALYINKGYGEYEIKNMTVTANLTKGLKISHAKSVLVENCVFDASRMRIVEGSVPFDISSLSLIDIQEQNDNAGEKMSIVIKANNFKDLSEGSALSNNIPDSDTAAAIKIKAEKQGVTKVEIINNQFTNCFRDVNLGSSKKGKGCIEMSMISETNGTKIEGNTTTLVESVIANRAIAGTKNVNGSSANLGTDCSILVGEMTGGCGVWDCARAYDRTNPDNWQIIESKIKNQ